MPPPWPGVLERVRQGLLDDPVDRELLRGRELPALPEALDRDGEPGAAEPGHEFVQVAHPGMRERARLAGGWLAAGPDDDVLGGFLVTAYIPAAGRAEATA